MRQTEIISELQKPGSVINVVGVGRVQYWLKLPGKNARRLTVRQFRSLSDGGFVRPRDAGNGRQYIYVTTEERQASVQREKRSTIRP